MVLRLFPAVKLSPPSPPTWFSLVFAFCVLTTLPHAARATTISSLNPQVWFDSSSAGSVVLGTGSTLSQWNAFPTSKPTHVRTAENFLSVYFVLLDFPTGSPPAVLALTKRSVVANPEQRSEGTLTDRGAMQ